MVAVCSGAVPAAVGMPQKCIYNGPRVCIPLKCMLKTPASVWRRWEMGPLRKSGQFSEATEVGP